MDHYFKLKHIIMTVNITYFVPDTPSVLPSVCLLSDPSDLLLFSRSVASFRAPGTVACQAPLAMGFPRQENRSGWPFPSLGDLPNPGMEPGSPALQADFLPFELPGRPYSTLHAEKRGVMCFKSSETCVQSRGWPSDKLAQV